MGALHDLNPVHFRQGDDEVECMTVELTTGPQLADSLTRKEQFWKYLDQEILCASEDGVGIIIEIDSKAWAGKVILSQIGFFNAFLA